MSVDPTSLTPTTAPVPERFVDDNAQVIAAAFVAFTEGPAADADGSVYFSDIANNRIMKLAPNATLSVFRADSGRTNGNMFDQQGRLVSCEGAEMGPGGRRRMVRTDMKSGEVTVLTERFDGRRYNSPNDLAIDTQGRIYFTDSRYGDRSIMEMDVEGVYRLDPDGHVVRILAQPAIQQPNGIAVTPDDETLYLVDYSPLAGGNRKVWAFDLQPDGSPTNQRLVYDFGTGRGGDGMRLDVEGNLWVAAGMGPTRREGKKYQNWKQTMENPPGVYVITPAGELVGRIPIPEDFVTNLTFGGPDKKTLYVTAGKGLYQIRTKVAGWSVFPPLQDAV